MQSRRVRVPVHALTLLALTSLVAAPLGAVTLKDYVAVEQPSTVIASESFRQCTPLQQDDGTFENAFAWNFGEVQPPNLGAFAKHYVSPFPGPTVNLCDVSFFFTTVPQFPQGPTHYDAIIYAHDAGSGAPGVEVLRLVDIDPGPVGIWPSCTEHVVDFGQVTIPNEFWIAFWPRWVNSELEWFLCADQNGIEPPVLDHTIATSTGGVWVPVTTPGLGMEDNKNLGIRCRVIEDQAQFRYPPAGLDAFDSWADVVLDIPDLGLNQTIRVSGPTTVRRGVPHTVGGLVEIETEIISLDLVGVSGLGPVTVRQSPSRPSLGLVRQIDPTADYPAESFFDVFLEIDVNGTIIHNVDPIPMRAEPAIHSLPPYDDEYISPGQPIPIYNSLGQLIGFIIDTIHVPQPPRDCFFSTLHKDTDIFGPIDADGPVDIVRRAPLWNPGTQLWEAETEILSMDLRGPSGAGPVILRESPDLPSVGLISCESYDDFPCESFFDVFFELELEQGGERICNEQPAPMVATIFGLPPIGDPYLFSGPPILLLDCLTLLPLGQVLGGGHIPGDPFPWWPIPPPGIDCFCTTAVVTIDLGSGPIIIDTLTGPTHVSRNPANQLPDGTTEIPTEIVELSLSGSSPLGPVDIRLVPIAPSLGVIQQQQRGPFYPADSFFDVFVEIEVPGMILHNEEAIQLQAVINQIPPEEPYQSLNVVPLLDPLGLPIGTLLSVTHDPGPPFTCDWPVVLDCRFGTTGVEEPQPTPAVEAVRLYASMPNPFSGSTSISFDLRIGGPTTLEVYDIAGRLVTTLADQELAGQIQHTFIWDGDDRDGRAVRSGIYFVRLTAEGLNLTRKVILMR
jgi:hypothetical protein